MRLLYLTDRLSDRGGADNHLAQIIGAMHELGHRVSTGAGRFESEPRVPPGVDRRRLRGLASRVDAAGGLRDLDDLVADTDVVHLQNVMNPVALASATRRGNAVVTIQDHRFFCPGPGKTLPDGSRCVSVMDGSVCGGCIDDPGYLKATLELTRRRLAAVARVPKIVLSRYMADELGAVGERDVEVIPPWVEVGPERAHPGDSFVIGGRLVRHKGVIDGRDAWHVAGRPLRLVVAGEGPLDGSLDGARRTGWLDRDELVGLLRSARALLFPTRWQEPFGILGVEALAQGVPVIVADGGGTVDWSAAGCIRVPAGDIPAMAAAIDRLAGDPAAALELGRDGQGAVARRFSRRTIQPMLEAVYRRVAGD